MNVGEAPSLIQGTMTDTSYTPAHGVYEALFGDMLWLCDHRTDVLMSKWGYGVINIADVVEIRSGLQCSYICSRFGLSVAGGGQNALLRGREGWRKRIRKRKGKAVVVRSDGRCRARWCRKRSIADRAS